MTVILGILAVVFAVKWRATDLAARAMVQYMADRGYTLPTQKELRMCINKVTKRKFPWYSEKP